jgi:hypothetical protein
MRKQRFVNIAIAIAVVLPLGSSSAFAQVIQGVMTVTGAEMH